LEIWRFFDPNSLESTSTQFVASLKKVKRLVVDWVNKQRATCQVELLQIEEKLSNLIS
jgi:hypothetical protein